MLGGTNRGGSRANFMEGQLVMGALKIFQKLMTSVRCIQQFQTLTTDKRPPFTLLGNFHNNCCIL